MPAMVGGDEMNRVTTVCDQNADEARERIIVHRDLWLEQRSPLREIDQHVDWRKCPPKTIDGLAERRCGPRICEVERPDAFGLQASQQTAHRGFAMPRRDVLKDDERMNKVCTRLRATSGEELGWRRELHT